MSLWHLLISIFFFKSKYWHNYIVQLSTKILSIKVKSHFKRPIFFCLPFFFYFCKCRPAKLRRDFLCVVHRVAVAGKFPFRTVKKFGARGTINYLDFGWTITKVRSCYRYLVKSSSPIYFIRCEDNNNTL